MSPCVQISRACAASVEKNYQGNIYTAHLVDNQSIHCSWVNYAYERHHRIEARASCVLQAWPYISAGFKKGFVSFRKSKVNAVVSNVSWPNAYRDAPSFGDCWQIHESCV